MYRITETSPDVYRVAPSRQIIEGLDHSGMAFWRLERQMQFLLNRVYVSKNDLEAIAELELDVISFIALPGGPTQTCDTIAGWEYAIEKYTSAALFWKTIGLNVLRKECPIQFGEFDEEIISQKSSDILHDAVRIAVERAAARLYTFTEWRRKKEIFLSQQDAQDIFHRRGRSRHRWTSAGMVHSCRISAC
jgi:hypothetical protein